MPCAVVGRGVCAVGGARIAEAGSMHPASEFQSSYGVVQLVFYVVEVLAVNGKVENRLFLILVKESKNVFLWLYCVFVCVTVFGQDPLVRALLALGFG